MSSCHRRINANDGVSMYPPLINALNYALDELSRFNVPGLPQFQESRQIAFVRSGPNHTASKSYLRCHEPDIVLIRWDVFEEQHKGDKISYPKSRDSDVCCKPEFCISWRGFLSTLEIRPGPSKASDDSGKKSVDKPGAGGNPARQAGDFDELGGPPTSVVPTRPSSRSHEV